MDSLASSFLSAAGSALWHGVLAVPWWFWAGLAAAVVVGIAVLRVLTDWRVLLVLAAVAALAVGALWLRQHLIAEGYAEALPAIAAAKEAQASAERHVREIEACIPRLSRGYVWDVSQHRCLSISGAFGR